MARITIVPVSGLGNRMRVVASVVKTAENLGVNVRLVWQPAWDLRARFDELFQPISSNRVSIEAGNFKDTPATKENFLIPMLLRKFRYKAEYRCFRPSEKLSLPSLIAQGQSFYMDTCYALADYPAEYVRRCFHPLPDLEKQIEDVVSAFPPRTLGIHIRRSDNRMAIRFSPLTAFRKRVDTLLDKGEANGLFLCTDDERVRDFFQKTYGQRLMTRHIVLNRNTLQGIRDAVVDLWCLSHTDRLLGSYYSSFSETASDLSGKPIEIIREENACVSGQTLTH